MTKIDQNFTMTAGDTKYLDFTVDMTSSTLTGSTIKWVMQKYDSPVLTKTTTGGITITADKVFRVTLNSTDTITFVPGQYKHQAEVTDVTNLVSTVAEGIGTIKESLI